jgi:cytochrome c551/c552
MIRVSKKAAFFAILCVSTSLGGESIAHAQAVTGKTATISPQVRAQAEMIFSERCAVCHGANGAGDGPAASNLDPKPADFHNAKWQLSATDAHIAKIIVDGGTSVGMSASMASNPDLADQPEVVAALVAHIRSLAKR